MKPQSSPAGASPRRPVIRAATWALAVTLGAATVLTRGAEDMDLRRPGPPTAPGTPQPVPAETAPSDAETRLTSGPGFSVLAMDALTLLRCQRHRSSSYARGGENRDYLTLPPGGTAKILDTQGARGAVTRMWFTLDSPVPTHLQSVRLSCTFDDVRTVDRVPWGAFFATGPWRVNDVTSDTINVMRSRRANQDQGGPGVGSFNSHWQMPFARSAVIAVENGTDQELVLYHHVEYFTGPLVDDAPLLFHVTHRIAEFTAPAANTALNREVSHNHVFADIRGQEGFYAGTVLTVESHPDREGKWYEGDEVFVIDGQGWPPAVHGTGTEDYFAMAFGFHRRYQAFDHGVTHYERNLTPHDRFYDGRFTVYRWHVRDPIVFHTALHASIEAGHGNDCRQYYESTAVWYGRTNK